ncbi:MAG: lipid A deacylase LpxR family protein [Gammaproteobacteria bacterium]|nr:lipid A deacylase LpxR family protein [Gammaproteobacteria bacterium]
MYSRFLTLSVFTLFNLWLSVAQADQPDSGIGLYIDQDMLVPFSNEDRDYTMGMAFEFFWAKEEGLYPLDNLVRLTSQWLGMDHSNNDIVYSFMLGSVVYTPDDLSDSLPIFDDRPYSSLIYLSNKRVLTDHRKALAAEVLIGLLGSNVAKSIQTQLHTAYRAASGSNEPVNPQGWSHQISDGGEPTMRLRLSGSLLQPDLSMKGRWDLTTSYGLSLGYQTNLNVGVAVRAGSIKSPFWSLPFDPVNRGNFLPSVPEQEWYVWSALRSHLIIYDALLQGQFRESDVQFSANQIERVVFDGAVGLTTGFEKSQITFSLNAKTADLKFMSRRQIWGGLNFLFHF